MTRAEPAYEVLDDLAARAQRAYSELVHETPGFVDYFKASTPVSEIGALNIGSRPASRKPTTAISDLRAIPWVLAWSQSRVMLPGWYGTGTAFEEFIADGDGGRPGSRCSATSTRSGRSSARCCPTWRRCLPRPTWAWRPGTPSWSTTKRCGTGCSTRSSPSTTAPSRCCRLITGQDDLLADNPALARSVFNRFPYLEPLNHLQVELLRRYRSGDEDELVQRGILLTMSGLATALRNSG